VNELNAVSREAAWLRDSLGESLHELGQALERAGSVRDMRILQGGQVATGAVIAEPDGTKHRVYIRRVAGANSLHGECSCGSGPCVHIAAVAVAAFAGTSATPAAGNALSSATSRPTATGAPQFLCYVLDTDANGTVTIALWVTQACADAVPFNAASARREGIYPRYVTAEDRSLLDALDVQHQSASLPQNGALEWLLLLLATGRARWKSLAGPALKWGGNRQVAFQWRLREDGSQHLTVHSAQPIELLFHEAMLLYVDSSTGECGTIALKSSPAQFREFWSRPPLELADVTALNVSLVESGMHSDVPFARVLEVRDEPLQSLSGALRLGPGATHQLAYVYNGVSVLAASIAASEERIRLMRGDVLHRVTRDVQRERRIRDEIDSVLPSPDASRGSWLDFMLNIAPTLRDAGWQIEVEPDFPYRIATTHDRWEIVTQEATRADWFDLRLEIQVEGTTINLLPVLVSYLQSTLDRGEHDYVRAADHLFVRLHDGRYLPLRLDRIERIADALVELYRTDALNEQCALTLRGTHFHRVAQVLASDEATVLRAADAQWAAKVQALRTSRLQTLPAPEGFRAQLRGYQEEALGWLQNLTTHGLGGVLADDMGLGKTVQTLAHLAVEKQAGRLRKPVLIVAPVSVLGNWQQEIRRLAPMLRSLLLHGDRRAALFSRINSVDVVITGYPQLLLDQATLLRHDFSFVILDEAQVIKNPRAKVSQAARELRSEHRLCLTGTPMENHLGELWSLFEFLQPGLLAEESEFQRDYRGPIEKHGDRRRAAALQRRVQPFMLRRTKDMVARDLPPKTQIVEPILLDERQRDFYDGVRLAMHRRVREVLEQRGLARSHITVLDALLKMRQACCDPRLVETDEDVENIPSAKLDWLRNVLPELIEEGRRILLFSQFTSMLAHIEALARELGIEYCLLTGASQNRAELVRRFQSGAVPLFLISLKAGGVGLNLTAADTVIHYDPWWNPAVEAQATDRAHRIGQEHPVFVYKLVAQHTIEEKILQLQARKQALANQLYADEGLNTAQMSAADIEALFEA
jgi:SNF2 family DNA or RNA helicase